LIKIIEGYGFRTLGPAGGAYEIAYPAPVDISKKLDEEELNEAQAAQRVAHC
jgi:hypothetical protein